MLDNISHYHCEKRMIKLIVTGRHFWWQEAMMKINWLQYTFRIRNNGMWQEANKWTWPYALINELLSPLSPTSWEQHRNLNEKSIALCNLKLESILWPDFLSFFFFSLSKRVSQLKTEFSCKEQFFKNLQKKHDTSLQQFLPAMSRDFFPWHLKCLEFRFPFSHSSF